MAAVRIELSLVSISDESVEMEKDDAKSPDSEPSALLLEKLHIT